MKWTAGQKRLLRGTPLAKIVNTRAAYSRRVYENNIAPLFQNAFFCGERLARRTKDAPAPAVDFKLFEWALGTILSRSFDFQLSSPMSIWGQEPGGHRVIVPVADFFNHHHTSTAQLGISHDSTGKSMLQLRTNVGFSAGDQVYINYGNHSARENFLQYGFSNRPSLMADSEKSVPVAIDRVIAICRPLILLAGTRTTAYLSQNYNIHQLTVFGRGLQPQSFFTLRVLLMSASQFGKRGEGPGVTRALSNQHVDVRNEMNCLLCE